jgi:hypothetical protein
MGQLPIGGTCLDEQFSKRAARPRVPQKNRPPAERSVPRAGADLVQLRHRPL